MAQETNYQTKAGIKVYFGSESTFGTAAVYNTSNWWQLPVTDFTLPEASASVETGAMKAGKHVNLSSHSVHRPDTAGFPFDITMYGTATAVLKACQLLFEDGSSPAALTGNYAYPTTYTDGTASTSQMTILFQGAGADATNNDLVCKSCVATSMELSESLDSDGGMLMCKITLVTYYQPTHENFGNPEGVASLYTLDTGTPKNIRLLSTYTINSEEILPIAWNLSVSRTINRIWYKDTSTYDPFGYAIDGGFEISGSITVKRDDSVHDLLAQFKNGTAIAISLAEASNFTLSLPTVLLNETKPTVEPVLKQEIPFVGLGNGSSESDNAVSITIA